MFCATATSCIRWAVRGFDHRCLTNASSGMLKFSLLHSVVSHGSFHKWNKTKFICSLSPDRVASQAKLSCQARPAGWSSCCVRQALTDVVHSATDLVTAGGRYSPETCIHQCSRILSYALDTTPCPLCLQDETHYLGFNSTY